MELVRVQHGYKTLKRFWRALETGGSYEVAYSSVVNYHSNRDAPADYYARVSSLFGVRLEWLITGSGPMTREPERPLELAIRKRYPDYMTLPSPVRKRFVSVLTRYALTAPDGERVAYSDDGLEQLVEMAGDILGYIRLPWHQKSWGFVSLESQAYDRQVDQFIWAVLNALDGLLVAHGRGQPAEAVGESPLRDVAELKGVLTEPNEPSEWFLEATSQRTSRSELP